MGVFVNDTMTDTNGVDLESHTGETGATWTRHPSYTAAAAAEIISNRVRENDSGNAAVYYASGVPAGVEYDVQATVRPVTMVATFSGLFGRLSTSADDGYFIQYRFDVAEWRLFRASGGSYSQIGSYAQTLTAGTDYVCKLEIKDATKKVYIDTVERISSANNDITAAGRPGIRFIGSASDTDGHHWDTFSATEADAAATVGPSMLPLLGVG